MSARFKKGDIFYYQNLVKTLRFQNYIFFLNTEGFILFQYIGGQNGIIISDPYLLYEKDDESETRIVQYYGYDILIQERLFTEIPEKFLLRVIKDEENTE